MFLNVVYIHFLLIPKFLTLVLLNFMNFTLYILKFLHYYDFIHLIFTILNYYHNYFNSNNINLLLNLQKEVNDARLLNYSY